MFVFSKSEDLDMAGARRISFFASSTVTTSREILLANLIDQLKVEVNWWRLIDPSIYHAGLAVLTEVRSLFDLCIFYQLSPNDVEKCITSLQLVIAVLKDPKDINKINQLHTNAAWHAYGCYRKERLYYTSQSLIIATLMIFSCMLAVSDEKSWRLYGKWGIAVILMWGGGSYFCKGLQGLYKNFHNDSLSRELASLVEVVNVKRNGGISMGYRLGAALPTLIAADIDVEATDDIIERKVKREPPDDNPLRRRR